MSRDCIFRFLDDAAGIGVKAVSFVGMGESTLHPALYEAIVRCRENGLDAALGTNGYSLKDEELERALACLTYLRFNISAANPESYSRIMGCAEECFERVVMVIKECVRIKKENNLAVTLGIQMVLCRGLKRRLSPLPD